MNDRLKALFLLLQLATFIFVAGMLPAHAEQLSEDHCYLQTVGAQSDAMAWQLLDGEPLRVRTRIAGEEDLTVVNLDYSTRRWELSDPDARTAVQVERTGNRLCAAGRLDGESIHLCRSIDAAPWYQTLSLSLRPFLDSSQTALEFWSLRPKTLKPYKLRAVKQQDEEIEVLGKKILAQRVEIRLAGLGGLFWKAHYWFRDSDALFVRYCGPTGLPGASKTIVTLQPPI